MIKTESLIITRDLLARKAFFRHGKDLFLYERQGEIQDALKDLKLN